MEQPSRYNLEQRSFADNEFLIRTIQVAINACTSRNRQPSIWLRYTWISRDRGA